MLLLFRFSFYSKQHNNHLLRAVRCLLFCVRMQCCYFIQKSLCLFHSLFTFCYLWFFLRLSALNNDAFCNGTSVLYLCTLSAEFFVILFYVFFFHSLLFCVIPQFYGNSANYKRISGGPFTFFLACW